MLSFVHGNTDIDASRPLIVKVVTNVSRVDRAVVSTVKLILSNFLLLVVLEAHKVADHFGHFFNLAGSVHSDIRILHLCGRGCVELKHKVGLEGINYGRSISV